MLSCAAPCTRTASGVHCRHRLVACGLGNDQGGRGKPPDGAQLSDRAWDQVLAVGRVEEHEACGLSWRNGERIDRQNCATILGVAGGNG